MPDEITEQIAADIKEKYSTGEVTQKNLSEIFDIPLPKISEIVKGMNPKKFSDGQIQQIKEMYGTGNYTQSDLAEVFKRSVPVINKIVKGIKPENRKYKRDPEKIKRNENIVSEYDPENGITPQVLAEKYEMTHQNVSLILTAAGISPRDDYFSRLEEESKERKKSLEIEIQAKKEKKAEVIDRLSDLWKRGCSIERFRFAAGLKSVNSAQVKVVNLRKKYGEDKFPRRNKRVAKRFDKDQLEALSVLYKADPNNIEELAAFIECAEKDVNKRIRSLRHTYGAELFPEVEVAVAE